MDLARHAYLRLIRVTKPRTRNPVIDADQATSMADVRTALCIARGVPLDDITSTGHSLTRETYERSRQSWRNNIRDVGGLTDYTRPWYEEAAAYWAEHRPQFIGDDDWPDPPQATPTTHEHGDQPA